MVSAIIKPYFASLAQRVGFVSSKVPLDSPFDMYCPSIAKTELQKRTCPECRIYHASQASLKRHRHVHEGAHVIAISATEADEADDDDEVLMPSADNKQDREMPVIRNLFEWLQTAFENEGN